VTGPRRTHVRKSLALPAAGALRVVVVADTHGKPDPRSPALIEAQRPDHILHAGDIGGSNGGHAVLDSLAAIAPVTAVRGNIDAHTPGIPDAVTVSVEDEGSTLVTLLLVHIALYGTKLRADVARLARAEDAGIVACGHSHVPFLGRDRDVVVVNAGSIGPRRFHLPIVFAVLDVTRDGIEAHHVSCETGQRWVPPVSRL
jgi:putative phosphoesterase